MSRFLQPYKDVESNMLGNRHVWLNIFWSGWMILNFMSSRLIRLPRPTLKCKYWLGGSFCSYGAFFLDMRLDHDLNALKKKLSSISVMRIWSLWGKVKKDLCRKFLKNVTQIFDWAAIRMIRRNHHFCHNGPIECRN